MKKRMLSVMIGIAMLLTCIVGVPVSAEEATFCVGDYIIIGTYNNQPILWRYVADDDNGRGAGERSETERLICVKPKSKHNLAFSTSPSPAVTPLLTHRRGFPCRTLKALLR